MEKTDVTLQLEQCDDSRVKDFLKKLGSSINITKRIATFNIEKLPLEYETLYADRTIKLAKSITNFYQNKIVDNIKRFIDMVKNNFSKLEQNPLDFATEINQIAKTKLHTLKETILTEEDYKQLYKHLQEEKAFLKRNCNLS